MSTLIGYWLRKDYGSRWNRLQFDGHKETSGDEGDTERNEEAVVELVQFLDDKSLS